MGREQDLLFCKIAISTKRVSQEDAQKCLAIANRFEAEGKRRPQVGEIFLKKNLLTDQDVLKIYGAVQKRMDAQGLPPPAPARAAAARAGAAQPVPALAARGAASRGVAPAARPRAGRAVKARRDQAGEGIDSTTLWLGIVFGVVALGCLSAILYLLLRTPPQIKPPDNVVGIPKAAPLPPPLPATPGATAAPPGGAAAMPPAGQAPGAVPAVAPPGVPSAPTPAVAPGAVPSAVASPPGPPGGAAASSPGTGGAAPTPAPGSPGSGG